MTNKELLQVSDLSIAYKTLDGSSVRAVTQVSFDVKPQEIVSIVGESGSGKSTTAHAIVDVLHHRAEITSGEVLLNEKSLLHMSQRERRRIRGRDIGYVPQDPSASLNPVLRVGVQLAEVFRVHGDTKNLEARMHETLRFAGLSDPERICRLFPHEMSGGMKQRVLIAMALALRPGLVIADEPTSALDVTVQARILDNVLKLREELGCAVLLITHDLGVAADRSDRVIVMQNGQIVEKGQPKEIFFAPQEAYTKILTSSVPTLDGELRQEHVPSAKILEAHEITKTFKSRGSESNKVLDGISFSLHENESLGLVGESGSGKTTLARIAMGLESADTGTVALDGRRVDEASEKQLRTIRRDIQMVYQSPYSSLDPRMSVGDAIQEPLNAHRVGSRKSREERVKNLLDRVGLPQSFLDRKPNALSGGQRQRVAIARALALSPRVVVCDEPVSALDVTVQAQILELMVELQRDFNMSYLFISHDLAVVRAICHRVLILQKGMIVEQGPVGQIFSQPREAYTQQFLAAVPGQALSQQSPSS